MMLADILQHALSSKVPAGFVGGSDVKRTGLTIHKTRTFAGSFFITNCDVPPLPE